MTKVRLNSVLIKLNGFSWRAGQMWVKMEIGYTFSSVKEMSKVYNIRNCNYEIEKDGVIIRSVRNGRIDGYGKRIEPATYNF